jgi:Gpi18-like mannosyltransferase
MKKKRTQLKDKTIIFIYIFWRLTLFFIGWLAIKILPFKPSFPYHEDVLAKLASPFFWQWANFDGVHYIMIAQHGYKSIFSGITQAFFPLFPLMIRYLNYLVDNYLFSGLIVANLFFLFSLLIFKRLLFRLKIEPLYPLLFLLFFPTSYYFGAVYNESLFLFLSLSAFLFIEKKRWLLASAMIGFSCATRITGIFLFIPFMIYFFKDKSRKKVTNILLAGLFSLICFSGFWLYSFYLYKNFHDPFYFATVQNKFGASRQTDKIILLYQVIWRYFKMFLTVDKKSLLFYTISQEFLLSLFVLGLLLKGFYRSIKKPYLWYALFSFILPTLTGNFSSMPRYVLVIFPIFLVMDKILKTWQKKVVLFFFIILLIINTLFFLRGYWIA